MMRTVLTLTALLAAASAADAQEYDVARRTFSFIDDRLVVQVQTDAPGVLRVLRGDLGRVDVAGRAQDGFVGFALGGELTPQLRLSSVGGAQVEYLVVVPERVRLTVQLPDRRGSDLGPRQPSATFTWGNPQPAATESLMLPTHGGLYVVRSATFAPRSVDIPDLASVRSVSVRFEGDAFRIAASRPFALEPGTARSDIELRVSGDPLDLVIHVPLGTAPFQLRAGDRRLVTSSAGRPTTDCTGVVVQHPTRQQIWFDFFPQAGRLSCR